MPDGMKGVLSAAGRLAARGLRALGCRRLLARIKASERLRRVFPQAARRPGGAGRPVEGGDDSRFPERRWPDLIAPHAGAANGVAPAFMVIGAQKCGTGALFNALQRHPQVASPLRKEVHYFDFFHDRGPDWYRAHFPRRRARPVAFEASPYYLAHPLAPARAAAFDPALKLLAILRDPVERALSHHAHETAHGYETLPLAEALAAEDERLGGSARALHAPPYYYHFGHHHHSYLDRGRYAHQLAAWLAHFGRASLLVLRTEDLAADPAGTLARVFAFLDLPARRVASRPFALPRRAAALDAGLRAALEGRFAAERARLHDLLDGPR